MIPCMLARDFIKGMNLPKSVEGTSPPEGWIGSEKYDGYRSIWDSKKKTFLSRQNNEFNAPEWFKEAMPPKTILDGELWIGRNKFHEMGCVRKNVPVDEEWYNVKYIVYDLPTVDKPFSERIITLRRTVRNTITRWNIIRKDFPEPVRDLECPLVFAEQTIIKSEEHMDELYNSVLEKGGEGLMIKQPESFYEDKRSYYMLKVKPHFDEECIVIDYKEGKGKYTGMLGGFVCKPLINMEQYHYIDPKEKHEFTMSGMDDKVRLNYKKTHPIGTIISYIHSGKTKGGKPRHARYSRKRHDIIIKQYEDTSNSHIKRDQIISIFKEMADYEKLNGQPFKSRSYMKVISELKNIKSDNELTEGNLRSIKGIGDSIYQKINDILKKGTTPLYDKIKDTNDPRKVLINIHGIGPKKAEELVEKGYTTIKDLRDIKNKEEVFTNVQIIGLKYYEDLLERIPRKEIIEHETFLKNILYSITKNAEITITGSYRRKKDTSGDIDVLLTSNNKSIYKQFIQELKENGYLIEDLAYGTKKYNGISKVKDGLGRRIDIMYTRPEEYPFSVLYFTGSDDFNKRMRKLILEKGMTINEYSLRDSETKECVDHVFKTEKDIFEYIGMSYLEPWDRN